MGGGGGGHDKTIYRGTVIKEGLGKFAELSGGRPGKKTLIHCICKISLYVEA